MGDLVHDGHLHLLHHLGLVPAGSADAVPIEGDRVGQLHHPVDLALGEGRALVETEQILAGMGLLHAHDHVVDVDRQGVGELVEGVGDQLLEALHVDGLHVVKGRGPARVPPARRYQGLALRHFAGAGSGVTGDW